MKPRVFIGSSGEGRDFAYALQENLESDAEITVWDQDIFHPMKSFLDSLLDALSIMDFGVFIFSPDDSLRMRGQETLVARDNVIFELGLFAGRFGPKRSIFVIPKGINMHIPSDLIGITVPTFDANREDRNWRAALGPASNQIRKLLRQFQTEKEGDDTYHLPSELEASFFQRRTLISHTQQEILAVIEDEGECSVKSLKKRFQNITDGELHYRLEQLRLLMFIQTMDESIDGESIQERRYSLTNAYEKVYKSTKRLRTPSSRSAPSSPTYSPGMALGKSSKTRRKK